MTTALLTHADCLGHITPEGHPERVARLEHVLHALEGLELKRMTAPLAADDDLLRVHPEGYIRDIRSTRPSDGFAQIDGDTFMSPGSVDAAYRAAGAVVRAVDLVLSGDVTNAFCAIRPPGHHAETDTAMGFCLFGNAALAAKHALDHHGLSRVAVVDFDVHHGNGTQDLLWDEARALVITSQQMPLWPGSGRPDETGVHDTVLNIPLAPGSGGADMRAAYESQAFPRLRAFNPDLIIISAGFDAHQDDPLANLNWSTGDFAWITAELCKIADEVCDGRIVSTLEGGYDLNALAAATRAHVEELMKAAP
ncbi:MULTISPECIES: histone deacetylase family protein [unclassified Ruegeria]|uniref:histone deacetylase family protein n=1 Tax=unclassified Ruegeria TaxID=2625375 RepID=UPI001491EEFC|nr:MULTISPECIES: histone deacetylase family protein [unclassified Ruegeria]NOD33253.1 histone deacetylase family protein [Ruegeria sp. HKCCD7296]NOD48686.1 histone deacetylase family protein [Ruegeria sp. HKCCD5849]NOD52012.1 histone deacetylase family protein [Ruegeria sp. HKCCD5851]NOD66670.1 histone deacetylase family protein [Ruegeria sp. HKCCD7303]NOE41519.1 histone deacetylase family protein [Ruegeria sp. HKCCD7319]